MNSQAIIGEIPEDWEVIKLDNFIELETGKRAVGGGLTEGTIASIGGEHVDRSGNIIWSNMKFIPEDFYGNLTQGKVKLRDILMVKDGATTGKVAFVKSLLYPKVAVNEHVFIIRSKLKNKLLNEFLFYLLFSHVGQKQIKSRFHGIIGGIKRGELKSLKIPFPPLPEQQKIASVLSTVDEAIQKTDEIIRKAQELKRGLMQKLLTKGIGHTKFKQTEIGEIPEEWDVVKLKDILVKIQNGLYKERKFYGSGYQIVRMTELFKGDILKIGTMQRVNVSDVELAKYSLIEGDLLFARRSLKVEGSGKCVMVPQPDEPIVFESSIIRVTLNRSVAYPKFYLYYLNSPIGRRSITRIIRTVAVSGVTGKDLQKLSIHLPNLEEQQKIAEILSTIDEKIEKEKQRKGQLEKLKKGLMQDLLTGRVRVKVD